MERGPGPGRQQQPHHLCVARHGCGGGQRCGFVASCRVDRGPRRQQQPRHGGQGVAKVSREGELAGKQLLADPPPWGARAGNPPGGTGWNPLLRPNPPSPDGTVWNLLLSSRPLGSCKINKKLSMGSQAAKRLFAGWAPPLGTQIDGKWEVCQGVHKSRNCWRKSNPSKKKISPDQPFQPKNEAF